MKTYPWLISFSCLLVFNSCSFNNENINEEISGYSNTIMHSETTQVISVSTVDSSLFPNIIEYTQDDEVIENDDECVLPDITLQQGGIHWSKLFIYEPFPVLCDVPYELAVKIDDDISYDWFINHRPQPYSHPPEIDLIETRLTQNANFYSFLLEFKDFFTDEEIIMAFKNEKNYLYTNSDFPYEITNEQIASVLSMDEERILAAFISDYSIAKGIYYYTPRWLYYHTIDDYEKAELMPDEILRVLTKCRDITDLEDTFIDVVEYKLYFYAQKIGSKLTVVDICGYERDMTMPLPLKKTTHKTYYPQMVFKCRNIYYNANDFEEYQIVKSNTVFTLSWVYHNTVETYKSEGLMPDELIDMLPKYEELGILTDEAMEALKSKLYSYKENYDFVG